MVCCVATTLIVALPVAVPDVAVTVIVVPAGTPAADRLAVTVPFAAVVVVAPERVPALAANVTPTPLSALLLESLANTWMVADPLPSAGRVAAVVVTVNVATPFGVELFATVTVVFPDTLPTVAVTVITVPTATPEAVRVAVACPVEPVVAVVDAKVPALAENVTVTPETAAPLELVTTAVIVAGDDPSGGTFAVVLLTATAEGVPVGVLVPLQVEVDVDPAVPPLSAPQPLSLPQPAKASVNPNRAMIDANLRMFLS
jgi:hypothetical protein